MNTARDHKPIFARISGDAITLSYGATFPRGFQKQGSLNTGKFRSDDKARLLFMAFQLHYQRRKIMHALVLFFLGITDNDKRVSLVAKIRNIPEILKSDGCMGARVVFIFMDAILNSTVHWGECDFAFHRRIKNA